MADRGNAGVGGDLGGVLAALEERADPTDHLRIRATAAVTRAAFRR
ncbi:hypothetical protein [Actinopolymorpha pittospori]|uniref:Uncharacterized protein n=1 Tax=Actinopolymorpha pittospori TaxID=648752 RepID=A0A927N068_9ACTN|nr:hypothetical protein [Actinopolymorpha pittospori]MBE1608513.1 hypothetical protein [Actinopolymorpha pittospori]